MDNKLIDIGNDDDNYEKVEEELEELEEVTLL
jgi:hypothetical protein